MFSGEAPEKIADVALLAEGVDRNGFRDRDLRLVLDVALLAEGVDRNTGRSVVDVVGVIVALLAEGVDRNMLSTAKRPFTSGRPPRGGRG